MAGIGLESTAVGETVTRAPTPMEKFGNSAFRLACYLFAWLTVILVLYIVYTIARQAAPAIDKYGWGFVSGTKWDPNTRQFGVLPEIWGTLYSSLLAVTIGTLFGVAVAVFLSEHFLATLVFSLLKVFGLQFHFLWGKLPDQLEHLLRNLVELLAAIPSVVYGLWGIYFVIPFIRPLCHWLLIKLGWIPIFSTTLSGPGMLPAGIVLSIMILPTIAAISLNSLSAVPPKLRQAAYGLGATRWEAILAVILPTASKGIFGAVILAFGRALGETMALAMLIGNSNVISWSLFSPGNTLAALLANNFAEAGPSEIPVLMFAALILLAITLLVNVVGAFILESASAGREGAGQ
ncbi:MAG: phosphate ABC transporter permease subunit PstC [Syntrophobacteraceae bacterium]|nr:phosphate ABC transporter permease subunit PstC [Syntrophobacteraceae bacterium]